MNKEKIKAIFFDMDGVLIDSEPLHFEAHKKALEHFNIDLSLEEYMEFGVAKGDYNLYEEAAKKFGTVIDKNDISKLKKEIYRNIIDEKGDLVEGVLETLEYLKEKYNLAIVSSGARDINDFVVEKFGLAKYFNFVTTGDDVEKVKPFPDVYLKAIEMIGLEKDEVAAVEDSQTGVESAKNAGIECVAIPKDFTKSQDFSRADMIFYNISELKKIL